MTDIAIVNRSTVVSDADLASWIPAFEAYANDDVRFFWGFDPVTIHAIARDAEPDPSHWALTLIDHTQIMGDLGAHDDDSGTPSAFVAVGDDLRYGSSMTVTITHELAEMLVNPRLDRFYLVGAVWYAGEACDPVEADALAYPKQVGGIEVLCSDFVTPAYYGDKRGPQDRFDMRGELMAPAPATTPGGYTLGYHDGAWHTSAEHCPDGALSRRAVRFMGRKHRVARRPPAV